MGLRKAPTIDKESKKEPALGDRRASGQTYWEITYGARLKMVPSVNKSKKIRKTASGDGRAPGQTRLGITRPRNTPKVKTLNLLVTEARQPVATSA